MDFVLKLKWPEIRNFFEADRIALTDPVTGQTDLFVKAYNQFKFFWNLRAGHAVSFICFKFTTVCFWVHRSILGT